MRLIAKITSLVMVVALFAFVSLNAGDNKTKVSLVHNGHIITVAPEAVPAHLAHGDVLVNSNVAITIDIVNPDLGTVVGPTSVAIGTSATYTITPNASCGFILYVDGARVTSAFEPYSYTLYDVMESHTIQVVFLSLV